MKNCEHKYELSRAHDKSKRHTYAVKQQTTACTGYNFKKTDQKSRNPVYTRYHDKITAGITRSGKLGTGNT